MALTDFQIKEEELDELLDASLIEEHSFHGMELVVSYKLPWGFSIPGRAATVTPEGFDLEIGRKIARGDAKRQLNLLEAYRRQFNEANQ